MADDVVHQIKELIDKIETAKTSKARLEGERTNLTKSMKEDHGISTVIEAKTRIKQLQEEHETVSKKIRSGLSKVQSRVKEIEDA